jgi:hypothetical protein
MTNIWHISKTALRWLTITITAIALLAPGTFGAKAASQVSKKSCCQRCACCIESNPDQPQVPLALPVSSSRASVDQPAALPLALVAVILAQAEPLAGASADFVTAPHQSSAPIFLRHRAILI